MAKQPNTGDSRATSSELARIWEQSIYDYEKITGKVVKELPQPSNMDEIISFADRETKTFMGTRHPTGKLNAIRSYLGKNIDYIDTAAEFIADATAAVFPPTKAIYAVISYLLKTAKKLSAALDMIAKSFDEMNTVLERISFLDENRLPNIPGYRLCIGRVFTSLMAIFGISTSYLKSGRAVKFFSKLVKGDDDALQGAYDTMIQAVQRLDPATNMAALRKIGDVEIRLIDTQSEMGRRFDTSETQSKTIASNTEEILAALTQYRKEVATWSAPAAKLTQASPKDKDKDSGKDGSARKAVALNKVKKFFGNPTDPMIQFEDIQEFFVDNTMSWFHDEVSYDQWLENQGSPVLLISGDRGAGKSFLSYTIIRNLQRLSQDKPRQSVAYFFFREGQSALRSLKNALSAMVIQIAEQDVKYAEQAASELDASYDLDSGDVVEEQDIKSIWAKFYETKFSRDQSPEPPVKLDSNVTDIPSVEGTGPHLFEDSQGTTQQARAGSSISSGITKDDSGTLLYLVLDGMDQVAESETREITQLLDSSLPHLNIKVILASRPSLDLKSEFNMQKPLIHEIAPEKASGDIKRLVLARCESLSRIRKFRPHAKKSIVARLTFMGKSPSVGMLYVDRALQYLDSIGREGAVLQALHKLPPDLDSLYAMILTECSARRTSEEVEALRLFYASVAYSKRPLTLKESRAFMALNIGGDRFHVEDEIRDRSASILDLYRSLRQDAQDNRPDDNEEDTGKASEAAANAAEADEDDNVPLNFQERSLREFFRLDTTHTSDLSLGSLAANLALFLTSINAICGTVKENGRLTRSRFEGYAATAWLQHFFDLSVESASDAQVVQVVESIVRILSNSNNAAAVLERTSDQCYRLFGAYNSSISSASQQSFIRWAERGLLLSEQLLTPQACTWATSTVADSSNLMSELARGHVHNWYSKTDKWSAKKSFLHAELAVNTTKRLAPGDAFQKAEAGSAAAVSKIANIFSDIKIDQNAHRAIGLVLQMNDWHEEALAELKQSVNDSAPITDLFYTWIALGQVSRSLAGADDDDDDDDDDDEEEENVDDKGRDRPKPIEINDHAIAACDYANKALGVYPKKEISALSEYVKWHIQEAYIILAASQRKLGNLDQAITAYEEARLINLRQGYLLQQVTSILDEQKKELAILEKVMGWTPLDRSFWLALNEEDNWYVHELFQRSAKNNNKEDFMVAVYEELITLLDRDGNASILRYQLARVHHRVLDDPRKAKPLLNDLLDGDSCKDPVTGVDDEDVLLDARNDLGDIIYEEFRSATSHAEKAVLLKELSDLPKKQLASTSYVGYEIADSPLAIVLARMTRKMGPAHEYQRVMEATFQICIERLTDLDGSNDGSSLTILASILATLGGMERDANIAYTAQFSIIDPNVKHETYSDDESDSDDSDEDDRSSTAGTKDKQDNEGQNDDNGISARVKDETPVAKVAKKKPAANPALEGEELTTDWYITCDGECDPEQEFSNWQDGRKVYTCIFCADVALCEACHEKQMAYNSGKKREFWRNYCGKNHEYICGPMEGWRGVRQGVMGIGEEEVPFKEWIEGLQKRWKERWAEFWRD